MKFKYGNKRSDEEYRELMKDLSSFPFSFIYDGKRLQGFAPEIFTEKERHISGSKEKESVTVILDFAGELEITLLVTHYFTHGATEWTVWFENVKDTNSGIIEEAKTVLTFKGEHPVLKGILGDHVNQYRPYSIELSDGYTEFSSDTGRTTHINFPYFNLEYGDGGTLLAIGWAGTWKAVFSSDGSTTEYTASAVNGIKTYLKPGERIRTALFVSLPYFKRSEPYATNLWRSWFIEQNLPCADKSGQKPKPFSTSCLAFDTGRPNSDGSISETHETWRPSLEKMIAENVKVDFRWFDAGWYIAPDGTSAESYVKGHDWWDTIGTWELDPVKWPKGTFLESTDFARANGMKTLVWFEPERVTDPENLAQHYGYNKDWAIEVDGVLGIANNIGDPKCLKWTTDRICRMLRENKVEMYREDNNFKAAALWAHLDSVSEGENRRGITECKFIEAHYKMWDDIIACTLSYGGCGFVDSCAGGGGRNDIESLRRGIPLLRSDSDRTSVALRLSMTTSFNKWIPFTGANSREKTDEVAKFGATDPYIWRASYLPVLNVDSQFVYEPSGNFDMLRFGLSEWKRVNPYLLKDFYVLTPWHTKFENTDFTSYCYFDPETKKGVLFAFRGENCERDTLTVSLPPALGDTFILTDEDTGEKLESGRRTEIKLDSPRTARLIWMEVV